MALDEHEPQAIEGLAQAAASFLRRHPPFDRIEESALRFAVDRLALAYHARGEVILSPASGTAAQLFIVQRGLVTVRPPAPGGAYGEVAIELTAGECFPIDALLEHRPVDAQYAAAADTFCYRLSEEHFRALLEMSAHFRAFATDHLATLLRDSQRLLRMHAAAYAGEERAAHRTLRSLVGRAPVACSPDETIEAALRAMQEARVGSVLVVGADGALAGILTRHDVLDRIALARRDLSEPVERVMTAQPRTLDADASAYDAALLIAREGIRHVPVIDDGRPIGVVTERDLFALQRSSMRTVRRTIHGARDLDALVRAAADVRALAKTLLEQGVAAEQLTYIISTLNDALTERVIALALRDHALDDVVWCWLAFGSEGRYEQTISTDQDNGIVFADGDVSAEQVRESLLPFAQTVNRMLDACGFPLCKGGIMAGNPRWCLSESEWRASFGAWVRNTDAQELLMSVIFFDLRALHGARHLAESLRRHIHALVSARPVFLRQLAQYAIETRPPLSFLGGFTDDPRMPGTLDLKSMAARIFTDAARVLALASGVEDTNTAQRLRHAGSKLNLTDVEIASAVDAFFFVQTLRLRVQVAHGDAGVEGAPNRVYPKRLNEVDQRMLKESLRQVRRLQTRLALDYQL